MIDYRLIKKFGCTVVENTDSSKDNYDFYSVNAEAIKRGYFVLPQACSESVMKFLKSEAINPNSTFYTTWNDILSKSRYQLFLDQMLHYWSTYGTDYEAATYIPNENYGEEILGTYKSLKIISAVTEEEMFSKCISVLTSGAALKRDTMVALCDYVCEKKCSSIDPDSVSNKEAQVYICTKLDIVPNKPFNLLRYIVYRTTGSFTLIKDKGTIQNIEYSLHPFDLSVLTVSQLKSLASIFYRYKPLFLAMKRNVKYINQFTKSKRYEYLANYDSNTYLVNIIRRLAAKCHKPFVPGFWETLIGAKYPISDVISNLDSANNFKLVSLLNLLNAHLCSDEETPTAYFIRNGKMYVKTQNDSASFNNTYYTKLFITLYNELVNRLRAKKCYVKYPENLNIACPTSEKNFVGNLPVGSYFDINVHNFIGIYWKNDWGTHDFDLSMLDTKMTKIGWNAQYTYYGEESNKDSADVIYSGDMTNADPEAAEILYFNKNVPEGTVMVNRYNGETGSKYRLFFGSCYSYDFIKKNVCMIDPGCITLNEDCESSSVQQNIGLVYDNKFYVSCLGSGNNIVSRNTKISDKCFEALAYKTQCMLMLKDVLSSAGFIDMSTLSEEELEQNRIEADDILDLSNLTLDSLIGLFS